MFIKQIIDKGKYFPNWGMINGPTGKRIKNIGKFPNGNNIEVDSFVMNGKTLRKSYKIWNNSMIERFHKIRNYTTGKFERVISQYEWLDPRFWEKKGK